jgi:phosphoribosylformylglycinamidine synthase
MLGWDYGELGGSEYLALLHDTVAGPAPRLDLARERALQRVVIEAIREGLVESAHDCAEGGLAVALAECCFDTPLGVTVDLTPVGDVPADYRVHATLFGESASRIVVSARPHKLGRLREIGAALGVPIQVLGGTGGQRIRIQVEGKTVIDVAVSEAETRWATAIESVMVR